MLVAALARWWVVFGKVVENDYMTYLQSAPCAIATTDRCSLAQALCTSGHTLGIRRYSATLLWIGIGFIAVALATSPRAGRC
jgi:hypothetical protein